MPKEIDISNELGRCNWMDVVAGEAVVLGRVMNEPHIVARATELSSRLREVDYNADAFSRLQAEAVWLEGQIVALKDRKNGAIFIDEKCVYRGKEKSCIDWEYDFIFVDGRYQINMLMPEYTSMVPSDQGSGEISGELKKICEAGKGEINEVVRDDLMGGVQEITIVEGKDAAGITIWRKADFVHECGWKRGSIRVYFFDGFIEANQAWRGVCTTLSRGK